MTNKPVGGRGKKAPYETQIIRVPVPIVQKIEQIISEYRSSVIDGETFQAEKHSEVLKYKEEIIEAQKHLAVLSAILLKILKEDL
jgi:hypothetical protein